MVVRLFVSALAVCLCAVGCAHRPSDRPGDGKPLPRVIGPASEPSYVRSLQTGPDCFVRQTGSRKFRPSSGRGPDVELVAAVHIAEPAYYRQLQRQLDHADLVLYEGVASGARPGIQPAARPATGSGHAAEPPRPKPSTNITYQRLAELLGLASQEHAVRYTPPRYQRCDMTLQEIRDLLAKEAAAGSGEEARAAARATVGFNAMRGSLGGTSWRVKWLLFTLEHSAALRADAKLRLAIHFPPPRTSTDPNPRLSKLIIDDRDHYIMDRLRVILAKPSGLRHITLFYGAGHMPGLEQRLRAMGYRPAGPVRWRDAITSRPAAEGLSARRAAGTVAEYQ